MNFAEELFKLNEKEIFEGEERVEVEGNEILKNLAYIINLAEECIEILRTRDSILYEEAREIGGLEENSIKSLGVALQIISEYN